MKQICVFCETSSLDDQLASSIVDRLGFFYQVFDYHFHANCLVFSSDIDRTTSLNGFEKENIEFTLSRAKKRKCFWCRREGATVKCSGDGDSNCEAVYHFPCALESKTTSHEFFDKYRNYCSEHNPHVCIFDYEPITGIVLRTDCCLKVYSHHDCIEKYVHVSKSLTKCPLCYDMHNFRNFIITYYTAKISKRTPAYARWSDSGMLMQCAAETCLCVELEPEGRFYHEDEGSSNDAFELIDCSTCGSESIHRICGAIGINDEWMCTTCDPNSDPQSKAVTKKKIQKIINFLVRFRKWILLKLIPCLSAYND